MPNDSLDTFRQFSPLHFVLLAIIVSTAGAIGMYRRRLRRIEHHRARVLDIQVSAVVLFVWIVEQAIELIPVRYKIGESIPLHICDIAGLVGALAVRTHWRLPRAVAHYWGLMLSPLALILPDLGQGPTKVEFWIFWVPHGTIVAAAIYDYVGRRYRPDWIDYAMTVGTLLLYLAIIIPFNLWLNVNYGYVGDVNGGPLDFLGPWPFRVVKVTLGVCLVLALMTIPSWIECKARRRRETASLKLGEASAPSPRGTPRDLGTGATFDPEIPRSTSG